MAAPGPAPGPAPRQPVLPSYPYQPRGFPILHLPTEYKNFFGNLDDRVLPKAQCDRIREDWRETYLESTIVDRKLEKRSKICQDDMHTHPQGIVMGSPENRALVRFMELFCNEKGPNDPFWKPITKLLSYCKPTASCCSSHTIAANSNARVRCQLAQSCRQISVCCSTWDYGISNRGWLKSD
jgi:hypothetical protein